IVAVKRTVPADFASTWLCTAVRDAAPPMWNVRIVSCVPGSPIDRPAIAPVALRADTPARGAGERRADLDLVDSDVVDRVHCLLVEQRAGRECRVLRFRMQQVAREPAAEDALLERLDAFAPLDQRLHRDAVRGCAIFFGHHQ